MQVSAFDHYAADYDVEFSQSSIGQLQRSRVYRLLSALLKKPLSILELNCGTGVDALWLAQKGHHVLATDVSENMLAVAKSKLQPGLHLDFKRVDLCEPEQIDVTTSDFVFSNFGGLNCINPVQVKNLATSLAKQMKPHSHLALVVMGRRCWWERFYFTYKADTRKKRRMSRDGVPTTIRESTFLTWYYSPDELEKLVAPVFIVKQVEPIGLFIPPSYLESFFQKKSVILLLLNFLEKISAHGRWLANRADHYWILFERNEK
jgi:SAM-dependent methyltransferase